MVAIHRPRPVPDVKFVDDRLSEACSRKAITRDLVLRPGTYRLKWNPNLDASELVRSPKFFIGDEARKRILKPPRLISSRARLFARSFDGETDDGLLVLAVDESAGTGRGYDRIYVDTHRNRDLSDDQPIDVGRVRDDGCRVTGWLKINCRQGNAKTGFTRNKTKVRCEISSFRGQVGVYLSRKGGWTGVINTNKGPVACGLVDVNSNGIYSDRVSLPASLKARRACWDVFFADVNHFGRLRTTRNSPHTHPLNAVTMVAGKLYDIRPSDKGDSVTINRYAGGTGTLLLDLSTIRAPNPRVDELWLIGRSGYYQIKLRDPECPELPVGRYKLAACTVRVDCTDGKPIALQTTADAIVNVRAGRQTRVPFGGKLSAAGIDPEKKTVQLVAGRKSILCWSLRLGRAVVCQIERPGSLAMYPSYGKCPPTVRFFDKSGKQISTCLASYT